MATGPKLLLLDEIAGGLTDGECQSLVRTIRDIHAEGVTIIWIEHVLHALNSVVERLVVLDFGRVIAMGAPGEIMESREVREIYLGIEA
jgi:branched-chain amino acid transport system ATP-binding protein